MGERVWGILPGADRQGSEVQVRGRPSNDPWPPAAAFPQEAVSEQTPLPEGDIKGWGRSWRVALRHFFKLVCLWKEISGQLPKTCILWVIFQFISHWY